MGRKMPLSVERKKNMNIYVCVKHVPDSAATITVDGQATASTRKVTFLVNPYDEHALDRSGNRIKAIVMADTEVIGRMPGSTGRGKHPAGRHGHGGGPQHPDRNRPVP
jgi:hypothetical protein